MDRSKKSQAKTIGLVAGIIVALGVSVFLYALPGIGAKTKSEKCLRQIKMIGVASTVWLHDNETNRYPSDVVSLTNELDARYLHSLVCPADRKRKPARNWASFTTNNCSYELVPWLIPRFPHRLSLLPDDSPCTNVIVRCQVHGHVCYADCTVGKGPKPLER